VIKTSKKENGEEYFKFEAKGIPDSDLNAPVIKFDEGVTKMSMSMTPGRRSLKDRKKSKTAE
jgi:hypothetical protein